VRFAFDLNGDGQTEQVPLLSGHRGYLALDRNSNQRIDSGSNCSALRPATATPNWRAMTSTAMAGSTKTTPCSPSSRCGCPRRRRGTADVTQGGGVGALSLAATQTPFALRTSGNDPLGMVRSTSAYLREDGGAGTMQQIDLAV